MKRLSLSIAGLFIAIVALGTGAAHADVGVTFDQTSGSIVVSAPAPSDLAGYPDAITTVLSGTAHFDIADAGVQVQFTQHQQAGRPDPSHPENILTDIQTPGPDVVVFTGDANLVCDGSNVCTWTFRVPFFITPGDYQVTATATELNLSDPQLPGPSSAQTITVTVV